MNLKGIIPNYNFREADKKRSLIITKDYDLTKETRQASYEEVLINLGERQRVVYEYLKSTFVDGATAKELSVALFKEGLAPSPERNSVHPRLNELVKLGLINVVGKKDCKYTGRKVAIYKGKS